MIAYPMGASAGPIGGAHPPAAEASSACLRECGPLHSQARGSSTRPARGAVRTWPVRGSGPRSRRDERWSRLGRPPVHRRTRSVRGAALLRRAAGGGSGRRVLACVPGRFRAGADPIFGWPVPVLETRRYRMASCARTGPKGQDRVHHEGDHRDDGDGEQEPMTRARAERKTLIRLGRRNADSWTASLGSSAASRRSISASIRCSSIDSAIAPPPRRTPVDTL